MSDPSQSNEHVQDVAAAADRTLTSGTVVPRSMPALPTYDPPPRGQIGQVRSTGICMLLAIVTLGFYTWFWYYNVHSELQRHRRNGLGGGVALVLAIFLPFVLAFLTPAEVGSAHSEDGRPEPVSGLTGLWILLPLVGAFVWFIKTNGAINRYWEEHGAVRS